MNLQQTLLDLSFQNPLVVASGKWSWESSDWEKFAKVGVGGITTKSFWNHEHTGNSEPVVAEDEFWTLNAVGLPDHGPEHSQAELKKFLANSSVPLIVSILGMDFHEYAANAKRIAPLKPSALEINLSSPTFLKLKGTFFDTSEATAIIPAVKKEVGDIPVFVKLSPNISDIGSFAAECVRAGADGITAINTLGTGLAIDIHTRKPILSAERGGLSGPGIKPLAVRCIADIYLATKGSVPIIGIGGVMTGEDVVEMMLAGASLIGLASVLLREGPAAVTRIEKELVHWGKKEGVKDVSELVGGMHR